MTSIQALATEFALTIANGEVWLSIGLALLLGSLCWAFGTWVARTVGLLQANAPAGEILGVGLACGLMVLAAWWAAIWSGGRSAFTPVAVGFAIGITLAIARRARPRARTTLVSESADTDRLYANPARVTRVRSLVLTVLAGGMFVVVVALAFGSTMLPSPRDGVQPVEFTDVAFYAALGRDLATTGTEANYSPSGFSEIAGLPIQTWYHWGELWLASGVITIFGTAPLAARYFVVLPIALLAAAALTGTFVRRMATIKSRRAYLFGFAACLFLAPVPLIPGPFFSSWAVGMMFSITLYGMGAVAVALALYCVTVLDKREDTWALAGFVGSAVAFIFPAHIVIALLALVGVLVVCTIRIVRSLSATRRLPIVSPSWGRTIFATTVALVATVVWGTLTGHALAGSVSAGASPSTIGTNAPLGVTPFNTSWRESIAIIVLGAGAFLAIPVVWFRVRKEAAVGADLYVGTAIVVVLGAIGWGARLGDFNMYHVFFGGIAVIATPVAAVAVWMLLGHLRESRHMRLAFSVAVLCVLQLEVGSIAAGARFVEFGPHADPPIAMSVLRAIRQLPPDAKLAYTCGPLAESGFADPTLVSIDAHTGRSVVPMCFEADFLSTLLGAQPSLEVMNPSFKWAPQRALFPNAAAKPSSEAVAAFLKAHGIGYIYADAMHPNSLVDSAVPIETSSDGQVLMMP